MAGLDTLVEQHMEAEPPTVAIQATIEWEQVLALVKLQEGGLAAHLPVKVTILLNHAGNIITISA